MVLRLCVCVCVCVCVRARAGLQVCRFACSVAVNLLQLAAKRSYGKMEVIYKHSVNNVK